MNVASSILTEVDLIQIVINLCMEPGRTNVIFELSWSFIVEKALIPHRESPTGEQIEFS